MRIFVAMAVLIGGIVFGTMMLPTVAELAHDARSESVEETGLACTTGVGETSCTLSLDDPHLHPDTSHLTVQETSPGSTDRTSATSVGDDQDTLTVSSLSGSTNYSFTVDYERVDSRVTAGGGDDFLRVVPLLYVLMVVVLSVLGAAFGFGLIG